VLHSCAASDSSASAAPWPNGTTRQRPSVTAQLHSSLVTISGAPRIAVHSGCEPGPRRSGNIGARELAIEALREQRLLPGPYDRAVVVAAAERALQRLGREYRIRDHDADRRAQPGGERPQQATGGFVEKRRRRVVEQQHEAVVAVHHGDRVAEGIERDRAHDDRSVDRCDRLVGRHADGARVRGHPLARRPGGDLDAESILDVPRSCEPLGLGGELVVGAKQRRAIQACGGHERRRYKGDVDVVGNAAVAEPCVRVAPVADRLAIVEVHEVVDDR